MLKSNQAFSWTQVKDPLHLWIVGLVFGLDQLTKVLVIWLIPMGHHIPIFEVSGLGFDLVHTTNKGAAFGLFHNMPPFFRLAFFGVVTIACLYLLIQWIGSAPKSDKLQRISLCLILGGALGNVIDRALFGEVTDFLDFFFRDYHWPAFNIADSGITCGVVLMLGLMLFRKNTE